MEDEKQEGVEMNDEQNKDIDQQRITKYKDIFDKHKNEEGFCLMKRLLEFIQIKVFLLFFNGLFGINSISIKFNNSKSFMDIFNIF